jgi:hypothetical protein
MGVVSQSAGAAWASADWFKLSWGERRSAPQPAAEARRLGQRGRKTGPPRTTPAPPRPLCPPESLRVDCPAIPEPCIALPSAAGLPMCRYALNSSTKNRGPCGPQAPKLRNYLDFQVTNITEPYWGRPSLRDERQPPPVLPRAAGPFATRSKANLHRCLSQILPLFEVFSIDANILFQPSLH